MSFLITGMNLRAFSTGKSSSGREGGLITAGKKVRIICARGNRANRVFVALGELPLWKGGDKCGEDENGDGVSD